MTQALLLDFDGTLVKEDLLDVVCELVGKRKESEEINILKHKGIIKGVEGVIKRINFLKGVSLERIKEKIQENPYLEENAKELLQFCKENNILTILASGNILPILNIYKDILGIDYVIGSHPKIENNIIMGITENDFPKKDFKVLGIEKILQEKSIKKSEVVALGDSPTNKEMFDLANISIAINPKGGSEKYTTYTITNLQEVIAIIKNNI